MRRRRKLLLFGAPVFDPDALDYIQRVETADEQTLEPEIKTAINVFFRGLKSDGIYDALKASCILAGARTLSGALIPLKSDMPSPTNVNFVSGDYSRKRGLKGDGSSKYLDSNRTNNADPQNNNHNSVYITDSLDGTTSVAFMGDSGGGSPTTSGSNALFDGRVRSRSGSIAGTTSTLNSNTIFGSLRESSSTVTIRRNDSISNFESTSDTPTSGNVFVFDRNSTSSAFTQSRLSWYSIGESLDLTLLENRLKTLMDAYENILS